MMGEADAIHQHRMLYTGKNVAQVSKDSFRVTLSAVVGEPVQSWLRPDSIRSIPYPKEPLMQVGR